MNSPYQYFTEEELTCNCGCGQSKMEPDFMVKINAMRRELGFPFIVTSAYRCPEYNAQISSTGGDGPHTTGRAIDIAVSRKKAYKLLESAFDHGMTGIGVSQKGQVRFIHLDDLYNEYRPNVWSY